MSHSGVKHKLQFLIGDHILPYNMTVYQAVKNYSPLVNDQSETDTDSETPIGDATIWIQQHTIYYRPIEDDSCVIGGCGAVRQGQTSGQNSSSFAGVGTGGGGTSGSGTGTGSGSSLSKRNKGFNSKIFRRRTEIWIEGMVPTIVSPLTKFLTIQLPADVVTVQDASLDALAMLRIVNGLNRHWNTLYSSVQPELIINQSEFIHPKVGFYLSTPFRRNKLKKNVFFLDCRKS